MRRCIALIASALVLVACASSTPEAVIPSESSRTGSLVELGRYFDCLRENNITVVAAHRLGGSGFEENTVSALTNTFFSAIRDAPVILELDIRQTNDGALVIMHDETVDRTTTGTGRVDAMTLEQFKALRTRTNRANALGEMVPSLADVLALKGRDVVLQLDVKRGVPFEDVVKVVQNAEAQDEVIVIVYSLADAITVHNLDPSLMLSVSINSEEELDTLARVGVDLSRVLAWTGTREPRPELYRALRARGVEVLFGTLGPAGQSIDSQIEQSRAPRRYVEIAKTGVTMIATSRFKPAAEALLEGGVGNSLKCVRQ